MCTYAVEYNSRSVLEWMVEHGFKLDSCYLNRTAKYGHLDLVRWMHEEQHVPLDNMTMSWAALSGNISLLRYVMEKGGKLNSDTLSSAAWSGSEVMVRWLHDEHHLPWSSEMCTSAAENGHLSLLQYLRSQGCEWDAETGDRAAMNGHLSVLRWATEHGCPITYYVPTVFNCAVRGHLDVLQFLYQYDSKRFLIDELEKTGIIGSVAQEGHLYVVQFLYPLQKYHYGVLLQAVQCKKSSALEVVQWLIECAKCKLPDKDKLEHIRDRIRLDVDKYLEEKGLVYIKK